MTMWISVTVTWVITCLIVYVWWVCKACSEPSLLSPCCLWVCLKSRLETSPDFDLLISFPSAPWRLLVSMPPAPCRPSLSYPSFPLPFDSFPSPLHLLPMSASCSVFFTCHPLSSLPTPANSRRHERDILPDLLVVVRWRDKVVFCLPGHVQWRKHTLFTPFRVQWNGCC